MTKEDFYAEFLDGKIAVRCDTQESYDLFRSVCTEQGFDVGDDFDYATYPLMVFYFGTVVGWTGQGNLASQCQILDTDEWRSIVGEMEEETGDFSSMMELL